MKTKTSVWLVVLLLGAFAWADEHHDQEGPFTTKKITDHIYVLNGTGALYGRGGTVGFFIGPDSVLVIDSQFMGLAPGIVDQIRAITDKPIKYLLNTHHHMDHTGGNSYFLKFALILAHDNVRKRVLAFPSEVLSTFPAELEEAKKAGKVDDAKFIETELEWAKKVKVEEIGAPFLTFDSEFRIYLGDETIQIWHTPPAHTDGDSVVYFEKAKVLHMADLFFNKVIPFVDQEAGGSATGYLAAIDKVIARVPPDVIIIPGHGEVSDLSGLKRFRQYMQDLVTLAQQAKDAGKSKEDFLKEADLPAYHDWTAYDRRFKQNAGAAYDAAK